MEKPARNSARGALPRHVAIIMDGNRRWARARSLPAVAGHKKGVDAVHAVVKAASDAGIEALTLYAFSTENWNRSKLEVKALMFLLERTVQAYCAQLDKENVRLRISGRLSELPPGPAARLRDAERRLSSNTGMVLNLAINYGGRQEILDAVNAALSAGLKKVDEKSFSSLLYSPDLQDPDLIIRTSGEMRISNFLLWQGAYSEFYVTEVLWPDFGAEEFEKALKEYQRRDRRRGA